MRKDASMRAKNYSKSAREPVYKKNHSEANTVCQLILKCVLFPSTKRNVKFKPASSLRARSNDVDFDLPRAETCFLSRHNETFFWPL